MCLLNVDAALLLVVRPWTICLFIVNWLKQGGISLVRITPIADSVDNLMSNWFGNAHFKHQVSILRAVAVVCLCWELWKARNRVMFEEVSVSGLSHSVILHTTTWLQDINKLIVPSSNLSFLDIISLSCIAITPKTFHGPKPLWIKWQPPDTQGFKLNVDGSAIDLNSAVGGCIRDSAGGILLAFSCNFGQGNNMEAEAKALRKGFS